MRLNQVYTDLQLPEVVTKCSFTDVPNGTPPPPTLWVQRGEKGREGKAQHERKSWE